MHVANRHGQRIGGVVRRRHLVQSEQQLDHLLHLPLVRAAVSHDGALHFGRRVFEHLASRLDRGQNRDAARVTELERASGVGRVEQILDDDAIGATLGETGGKLAMDSGEAVGKGITCGRR